MTDGSSKARTLVPAGMAVLAAVLLVTAAAPLTARPAEDGETAAASGPTNGVIVRWNPVDGQYEAPSAEQAAALVRELREALDGEVATRMTPADGELAVKTLPNGLRQARVPVGMLELSIVRVQPDGGFAGACVQGPEAARDSIEGPRAGGDGTPGTRGTRWEVR